MLQTILGKWRMQTLQILHVSHGLPSSVFPRHRSDLLMTEILMIVVSKFFSKLLNLDCHKLNYTTNAIWERKRSGKIMTEPFLSFSLLPIIITCKQLFHVVFVRLSRSGITGCLSLRRSNSLWDLQITCLASFSRWPHVKIFKASVSGTVYRIWPMVNFCQDNWKGHRFQQHFSSRLRQS